jgi:transposase
MVNHLKMAMVNTILTLNRRGWSMRRITRELGIDRETVKRYTQSDPNPATNAPIGWESGTAPPVHQPPGIISYCESYFSVIQEKVDLGLNARRIYQDLVAEPGYADSYYSVRRFVKKHDGSETPLPFRRMECVPGEEAQIDFGSAAPVIRPSRWGSVSGTAPSLTSYETSSTTRRLTAGTR